MYITDKRDLKMGREKTRDFSCIYHILLVLLEFIQIRRQWSERSVRGLRIVVITALLVSAKSSEELLCFLWL